MMIQFETKKRKMASCEIAHDSLFSIEAIFEII